MENVARRRAHRDRHRWRFDRQRSRSDRPPAERRARRRMHDLLRFARRQPVLRRVADDADQAPRHEGHRHRHGRMLVGHALAVRGLQAADRDAVQRDAVPPDALAKRRKRRPGGSGRVGPPLRPPRAGNGRRCSPICSASRPSSMHEWINPGRYVSAANWPTPAWPNWSSSTSCTACLSCGCSPNRVRQRRRSSAPTPHAVCAQPRPLSPPRRRRKRRSRSNRGI